MSETSDMQVEDKTAAKKPARSAKPGRRRDPTPDQIAKRAAEIRRRNEAGKRD